MACLQAAATRSGRLCQMEEGAVVGCLMCFHSKAENGEVEVVFLEGARRFLCLGERAVGGMGIELGGDRDFFFFLEEGARRWEGVGGNRRDQAERPRQQVAVMTATIRLVRRLSSHVVIRGTASSVAEGSNHMEISGRTSSNVKKAGAPVAAATRAAVAPQPVGRGGATAAGSAASGSVCGATGAAWPTSLCWSRGVLVSFPYPHQPCWWRSCDRQRLCIRQLCNRRLLCIRQRCVRRRLCIRQLCIWRRLRIRQLCIRQLCVWRRPPGGARR